MLLEITITSKTKKSVLVTCAAGCASLLTKVLYYCYQKRCTLLTDFAVLFLCTGYKYPFLIKLL
jgi:hypothetical protein